VKITKRQLRRIIREVHPRAVADNAIFDYEEWVESMGHMTPSASSVMASYILAQGIEDEHEIHQILADQFSLNHDDVMRDLATQQQERRIAMGESRNGSSRRRLRKIVREVSGPLPMGTLRRSGGYIPTADQDPMTAIRDAVVEMGSYYEDVFVELVLVHGAGVDEVAENFPSLRRVLRGVNVDVLVDVAESL